MTRIYDLIVIGSGPAGIAAGIYAKNFGINFLMIGEKEGGLINEAYKVENYPGIFNISGKKLVERFKAHQRYLKVFLKQERVKRIKKDRGVFNIFSTKNKYRAKTLILAFGTETKKLDIESIEKFEDRGVYYQIDKNPSLFKDKAVAIIGGANAAVMTAVMLAEKARKVYLIYRRAKLRADALWVKRAGKSRKIEVIYNANVIRMEGEKNLEKITLDNGKELEVSDLVIEAGCLPNRFLIGGLGIKTDSRGYIKVDKAQATNVSGVFAAGDVTTGSDNFRQVITACAEGAIATLSAFNYLKKL